MKHHECDTRQTHLSRPSFLVGFSCDLQSCECECECEFDRLICPMICLLIVLSVLFGQTNSHGHHSLEDVLLVIHVDEGRYKNVNNVRQFYSPYFRQIVFYGEVANATLGIQAVNSKGGLLWHAALRHAMLTHVLNRTGYLLMNDDVLLNVRVARKLNFDKIWVASKETEMVDVRRAEVPENLELVSGNTRTREPNPAWKRETGFISSQLTIKYLDDRSWWTGHMRSMLQSNARTRVAANRISVEHRFQDPYNETMFHFSPNELVYIPAHLRKQFVRLCNVFIENHVVHTIALPTIVRALEPESAFVQLEYADLTNANRDNWQSAWRGDTMTFLHPLNFTSARVRDAARRLIDPAPPVAPPPPLAKPTPKSQSASTTKATNKANAKASDADSQSGDIDDVVVAVKKPVSAEKSSEKAGKQPQGVSANTTN